MAIGKFEWDLADLADTLGSIEDPRSEGDRLHPLVSVLLIAVMAVLSGAGGPTAIARWANRKSEWLGMGPIFGTQENFERYQISMLLGKHAAALGKSPRLILSGYGNFRSHHHAAHRLMAERKIPHDDIDDPQRKHHWNSGWLDDAVKRLLR